LREELLHREQQYKIAHECGQEMLRELKQVMIRGNENNMYLFVVSKYDFLNRYKVFVDSGDQHRRSKVRIKLKSQYKHAFVETIVASRERTNEAIQAEVYRLSNLISESNLVIPKSIMNSEMSSRSRNVQNNLYVNKTDNNINPNRMYYASDRFDKQKSIGSTIFRDHDTFEHFVADKKVDVIPIGNAMKPIPKGDALRSSIYDSRVDPYKIIEEEKNMSNKSEDEINYRVMSRNEFNTERQEEQRRNKKEQLRIEGTHSDIYWCCK
jgi:hypothetical protein